MGITYILSLIGGLALFLYGMQMMSQGLEAFAGNRLKNILKRLTSNRFMGITVGTVITAIIQSSSATTVMVVGFVNSKLMELEQAVWVIMGANIGTTITGQLIALDIGMLAPIIALVGVIMISFCKKKSVISIGNIIAGLGILFIGMNFMSNSMMPLRTNPAFINIMTNFKNPVFGIIAGLVFTAIIQSSSASVGILQALASGGLITLGSGAYVLFGQNIGTCITSVLASIGAKKNAKRTTLIHVMFNVIGTIFFVVLCHLLPVISWVESLTPSNPMAQIANMHTIFNIVTTLLLFPFGKSLAHLSKIILPGEDEPEGNKKLVYIKEYNIGATAIGISQLYNEIGRMFDLAKQNIELAFKSLLNGTIKYRDTILENEDCIDYLNREITRFMSKLSSHDMLYQDSKTINFLFKMTGDIERIGDHALNLFGYAEELQESETSFSKLAIVELTELQNIIFSMMKMITVYEHIYGYNMLSNVKAYEEKIDTLKESFCQNQISRMNAGDCSVEACVIYSQTLTDIERISDHILNISEEYDRISNI